MSDIEFIWPGPGPGQGGHEQNKHETITIAKHLKLVSFQY